MPSIPKPKRLSYLPPLNKNFKKSFKNPWYNTRQWQSVRLTHLINNPLCTLCKQQGYTNKAQMVDHIKPVSTGIDIQAKEYLMWNINNLQSLCNSCHAKKTGKESNNKK